MNPKNLIVASTSTLFGDTYLNYLLPEIKKLFTGCKSVVFVPYARPSGISHDDYTTKVKVIFEKMGIAVKGIHEFDYPIDAILKCDGIFIGGGNTFQLVSQLYKFQLINAIADAINRGIPYLGTSAGSVIVGQSMKTTNDMPVVYPPSFATLGILPYNLNCHYLDPDPTLKHNGETRETRIKEFHIYNQEAVLGLREGSWIEIKNEAVTLKGNLNARLFRQNQSAIELPPNTDLLKTLG